MPCSSGVDTDHPLVGQGAGSNTTGDSFVDAAVVGDSVAPDAAEVAEAAVVAEAADVDEPALPPEPPQAPANRAKQPTATSHLGPSTRPPQSIDTTLNLLTIPLPGKPR
jgi:hypothetical protein